MDQASFRQLLASPGDLSSSKIGKSRGSWVNGSTSKSALPKTAKQVDSAKPLFKPRKVKKIDGGTSEYRDRAAERRVGDLTGNDFADVEAVLADFDKQTRDTEDQSVIDKHRQLLGGDAAHTVLVKGLDFALLAQNKARDGLKSNAEVDEFLDHALESAPPPPPKSKKVAKGHDILKKLNEGRSGKEGSEQDSQVQDLKSIGKFRPIGFKPISDQSSLKKTRKQHNADDGKPKKKKKKKNVESQKSLPNTSDAPESIVTALARTDLTTKEVIDESRVSEDIDIFGDVDEYKNDLSDDESDQEEGEVKVVPKGTVSPPRTNQLNWFGDVLGLGTSKTALKVQAPVAPSSSSRSPKEWQQSQHDNHIKSDEEQEGNVDTSHIPQHLVPLSSSAVPSIKELLALDSAASGKINKNKKRKKAIGDNRGDDYGEKKLSAEARAERDYKRLKSFTDKKASVSKS